MSKTAAPDRVSRFAAIRSAAARQPHGTRARFVGGGCRCLLCRAANSRWASYRARRPLIQGAIAV